MGSIVGAGKPISLGVAMGLIELARENKAKVLEGAVTVENNIATIVSKHFFPEFSNRAHEFDLGVLRSDWCSYSAKRKMLAWIIESRNLLEGQEKQKYDKLLKDTMSYRNAFAHGDFETDGERVFLSYFEGSPKKQELTDDFLRKVESVLFEAHAMTTELSIKSGATARPKEFQPPGSWLVPAPDKNEKGF